jgi:hypothetical protein
MYTMLFAHMNSSLNPLVYAISNPLFQKGYKNLFNKLLLCKNYVKERSANKMLVSASVSIKINTHEKIRQNSQQINSINSISFMN